MTPVGRVIGEPEGQGLRRPEEEEIEMNKGMGLTSRDGSTGRFETFWFDQLT